MPLAVAAAVVIAAIVVWAVLFRPLFVLRPKLSFKMREEMFPDMQRASTSLTALASAALVLTFTVLQALSQKGTSFKAYLVASWVTFTFAIAFGISAVILIYICRAHDAVTVQAFSEALKTLEQKRQEPAGKPADDFESSLRQLRRLQRVLFLSLYAQAVCFLAGMVLLSAFAVANVLKEA